jgi:hypothetical protein
MPEWAPNCYKHQIRIDYPKWAEPLREALRENMERLAAIG